MKYGRRAASFADRRPFLRCDGGGGRAFLAPDSGRANCTASKRNGHNCGPAAHLGGALGGGTARQSRRRVRAVATDDAGGVKRKQ